MRIVLLSKTDRFSREAQGHARRLWPLIEIAEGTVGDARPPALGVAGDVLVSFLSPWIVTAEELARFPVAINFHPASVEYPGTGCYNFALYDETCEYGAVCHHMRPRVDTGPVILERRFPVSPDNTVETLKLATMVTMLAMFRDIADGLARVEPLPAASTHWTRRPYLRRALEALKQLSPLMSAEEIARRVRATVYPGYPGPVIQRADGTTFAYPVPERSALA
jgi:methionyl-tRNA formyltransferase